MFINYILFLLLGALCRAQIPENAEAETRFYTQFLDHFGFANQATFEQKYIISTKNYQDNGPIFLYLGNENSIEKSANNIGILWEKASEFNAAVVFLEHRYYGSSLPFGNSSFHSIEQLQYLSVSQALADAARLIDDLRRQIIPNARKSPVILFGGGYGGMLVIWHRMKYPHLTTGALASSAPFLQLPNIVDCSAFARVVTDNYKRHSFECSESIRSGLRAIRNLGASKKDLQLLSETFKVCEPLSDVAPLIESIKSVWIALAQVDYSSPSNFLVPLPANPIREVCKFLNDSNADDKQLVKNIYSATNIFYNYTGTLQCNHLPVFTDLLEGWAFQTRTEVLLPKCFTGKSDFFEPEDYNVRELIEKSGQKYKTIFDDESLPIHFGGSNFGTLKNVIFSNGERDPWAPGGLDASKKERIHKSNLVITIPNAFHQEDLRRTEEVDSKFLLEARQIEWKYIQKWINDYKRKTSRPNIARV